jgi:hypothetical protein
LEAKIKEAMANLPRDTTSKACRRFHQRLEAVVKVGGGWW